MKWAKNKTDYIRWDGMNLYFKLDSRIVDWDKVDLESDTYRIKNCICGHRYLIYGIGYTEYGTSIHSIYYSVELKIIFEIENGN